MLIQSLSSTSPLSTPVQILSHHQQSQFQQQQQQQQQQPTTKYSIRYHISYFLPYTSPDKLTKIQVSLDKSKSLQYNLKKWCIRLKLVLNQDPTPEQLAPFKLYKRVFPSMIMMDDPVTPDNEELQSSAGEWNMIQLHNKDFSQQDTLFLGKQDQVEKYCTKMRDRDMRRLMGEFEDEDMAGTFEDDKQKLKNKMAQLQLKKKENKNSQQRNLGDEFQVNDKDFEDIISLQSSQQFLSSSQESIVEVRNQVRKRGRPRKGSEINYRPPQIQQPVIVQSSSNNAHTISSTSVQMNGGASSDEHSLMLDDDDDYTGFDDFSMEERAQFGKNFPKKYKQGYKPSLNSLKLQTFNGQVQKIFQATKIDPQSLTYSQHTQSKLKIQNLNELSDESLSFIRSFLDIKKVFEYRTLVHTLNTEVFEKHYKFLVAIDSFPTLEQDGSQIMNLRCFRHLQQAPVANDNKKKTIQQSDNDESGSMKGPLFLDDEDDPLRSSFSNTVQICPLVLRFQTTFDGYWQIVKDQDASNICMHQPLLQAQKDVKKSKQQQQPPKVDNMTKFDDILNQKNTLGKNQQQSGALELFNDEFSKETSFNNLAQLNNKLKKNSKQSAYLNPFLFDDTSTKPSISPPSAGDNSLKLNSPTHQHQTEYSHINLLNDDFFTTPINHLTVIEHLPHKPQIHTKIIPSPQKSQSPTTSNMVPVDVIDSRHFLNLVSSMYHQPSSGQVGFKKNKQQSIVMERPPILSQNEMFDNVEDVKVYQGQDYMTKNEDMHKLIKHVRKNFTKGDFYRYETDKSTRDITSLIIATETMKEKYLIYRDVIFLSPCLQSLAHSESEEGNQRFRKMMGLVIYGVNSSGRNVIFAISLVKSGEQSSLDFVLRSFFFYTGKLPKALILERNLFGFDSFPTIAKILKKEFTAQTGQSVSKSLYIFSQNEPRVLYCSYSVQKEISQRFDFLKREEAQLFQLLISLPFLNDCEELELKLKEVQRINWGQSQQLDNLKDFLRRLTLDRMLWAQCYRVQPSEKQATPQSHSPPLPQQLQVFMGDISVTQRNVTIECNMSNYLLTQTSGEFYPREAIRQLQRLDEIDYSYTNESKLVATQQMQKLESNEVFKKFVVPHYSTYIQQRFKFQMQKCSQYTILDNDEEMLNSQTHYKNCLTWNIGNQDRKLSYKVTQNGGPQSILKCQCGFSQISGIPCSHEFYLQNYLYTHQMTKLCLLKFRSRWQMNYESDNIAILHRDPDGLMFLHRQKSYLPQRIHPVVTRQASTKKSEVKQQHDIVKMEQELGEVIAAAVQEVVIHQASDGDELHISNEDEAVQKEEVNAPQQPENCISGIKIQIPMPTQAPPKPLYLPRSIQSSAKKRARSTHSTVGGAKPSKRPKKEDSEHEYADDSDNGEDVFSQAPPANLLQKTQQEPGPRKSRRQAKQEAKVINFNQVFTQSSNGCSQKVVNPKYRFQKPALNGQVNYLAYSQPKSQQSIHLSQKSKTSLKKKRNRQKKEKMETSKNDEDTDSVLNLDDLLSQKQTLFSQDACFMISDGQCYSQLEKPPSTLEGWAGPKIFRNLAISKETSKIELC